MGTIIKGLQSVIIALGIIAVVGTGAVLYYNTANPPSNDPEKLTVAADQEENDDTDEALTEDAADPSTDEGSPEDADIQEGSEADVSETDSSEADTADQAYDTASSITPATPHEHDYYRTITKLATCTNTGTELLECRICGDSYTEEMPLKDHTPGEWVTERVATSTETGFSRRYCTVCGWALEDRTDPMLEDPTGGATVHKHTYETYVSKEPTCTAPGERMYACVNGDSFVKASIPPLNHPSKGSKVVDGNCNTPGSETIYCTICNAVINEREITYSHKWSEWYDSIMPNSTAGGTRERVCQKCGKVETKSIPSTNIE